MSDQAMSEARKPWPQPFEFLGNAIGVVILATIVLHEIVGNRVGNRVGNQLKDDK